MATLALRREARGPAPLSLERRDRIQSAEFLVCCRKMEKDALLRYQVSRYETGN